MKEKENGRHNEIIIYKVLLLLSDLVRNERIYYYDVVSPGTSLKDSRHASSGSYNLRDDASGSEEDDCDDEEEQVNINRRKYLPTFIIIS